LIEQIGDVVLADFPTREAAQHSAAETALANVDPLDRRLGIWVLRKPHTNIADIRAALDALPVFWFRVVPILVAVTNEVFRTAFGTSSLGDTFIVVSVQSKLCRATRAFAQPEFVDWIAIFGVRFEKLSNVHWLSADPPLSGCVNAHAVALVG
jgi:hypothetical protein